MVHASFLYHIFWFMLHFLYYEILHFYIISGFVPNFCKATCIFNTILHEAFDQRISHGGGGKNAPYPTPKLMGTPNLAYALVLPKVFRKIGFELTTLSLLRHGNIFEKMTSFLR